MLKSRWFKAVVAVAVVAVAVVGFRNRDSLLEEARVRAVRFRAHPMEVVTRVEIPEEGDTRLSLSPDGRYVVIRHQLHDKGVHWFKFVDLNTATTVKTFGGGWPWEWTKFPGDGHVVVRGGPPQPTLYRMDDWRQVALLPRKSSNYTMRNGRLVYCVQENWYDKTSPQKLVVQNLRQAGAEPLILSEVLRSTQGVYERMALNDNGTLLATVRSFQASRISDIGERDQVVSVWETTTGVRLHTWTQPVVTGISFWGEDRLVVEDRLERSIIVRKLSGAIDRTIPSPQFGDVGFLPSGGTFTAEPVMGRSKWVGHRRVHPCLGTRLEVTRPNGFGLSIMYLDTCKPSQIVVTEKSVVTAHVPLYEGTAVIRRVSR